MSGSSILAPRGDHGTRACYVAGCRCAACRAANTERYRRRLREVRERAVEVVPTGAPGLRILIRAGIEVRVPTCPGGNGAACVAGGTWIRGGRRVCDACVARHTVWNGVVSANRTRAHLLALRERGVGYKAVAAACDVAPSVLGRALAGGTVRASTERRVLAVDVGAIADGALVDAKETNRIVRRLRRRGFTLRQLGELFGYECGTALQVGHSRAVIASTAARAARIWRRVERGEIKPCRAIVAASAERRWIAMMLAAGVPASWLFDRVGVAARGARMRPKTVDAIRRFRRELEEHAREGRLPDAWNASPRTARAIARAFGLPAGHLV